MTADGFRALYNQTAVDLLNFLRRRTPTPEHAADCLADTFLIAWSKRDQIPTEPADARPWLFGVARNVLKRDRALDHKASATVEALALHLQDRPASVPANDVLTLALGQLAPIDREIIEMLAWDHLAPREVAAILGFSPNAVRIRAHRARIKLREQLRVAEPACDDCLPSA